MIRLRNRVSLLSCILYHNKKVMLIFAAVMLWYVITILLTTTGWSFPDAAIGKKYILARTNNGYELVPDGSKVPGIPVSSVSMPKSKPQPKSQPHPAISISTAPQPSIISDHSPKINLLKEENPKDRESVVTLALQGHDGLNGRPGPRGQPGVPGAEGKQGPPGLKGEPGTCKLPQFQCDINMIRSLTKRISQLEKTCANARGKVKASFNRRTNN